MKTVAERHDEELARTVIHTRSPRGFVTVDRDEHGKVRVRLRPDTLQRLTETQLATEITEAMQAAADVWMATSRNIYTRLTGVDHG